VAGQQHTWGGAIRTAAEARAVLDRVNAAGAGRATAALTHAVQQADEVAMRPDATRLLPVDDQIAAEIFPTTSPPKTFCMRSGRD
jgi:hypothetical protein